MSVTDPQYWQKRGWNPPPDATRSLSFAEEEENRRKNESEKNES